MAYENKILSVSFPCTVDLSASQYFVAALSSGNAVLAGVADVGIGILQNDPNGTLGDTASVMVAGISRGVAGAVIAEGVAVAPDAAGKLRTAVIGDTVLGVALEAAGADGDIIPVLLQSGATLTA